MGFLEIEHFGKLARLRGNMFVLLHVCFVLRTLATIHLAPHPLQTNKGGRKDTRTRVGKDRLTTDRTTGLRTHGTGDRVAWQAGPDG